MRAAWNAWVEAWCATEPGTTLALFRLALGVILFLDLVAALDVVDPLYVPPMEGGLARPDARSWLVEGLGGPGLDVARGLHLAALALSSGLLLGFGGRITAFLLLQTMLAIHTLPGDIGGGYDRLLCNGLWLLVLGNGTATLSLDCRLRSGHWVSGRPVFAFARYLAIYQVLVLYTSTGLVKTGAAWSAPYDAVYRSLNRVPYMRWDLHGWVADLYPLTQVGTVVAWWWEALFFVVGLWFVARNGWFGATAGRLAERIDLRIPFLGIGLFLHLLLWAVLDLGLFTVVTLAFYLTLYRPAEWQAVLPWTATAPTDPA